MDMFVDEISNEIDAAIEVKVKTRRQFTYSDQALKAGEVVDGVFVSHLAVQQALEALDRSSQVNEALSFAQGIRLIGPTGSGKSTLIRYFQASMPQDGGIDASTRSIYLRLQERPSVARLLSVLLRKMRYPFASVTSRNLSIKREVLLDALRQSGMKMLFLDEAHYLCQHRRTSNPDTFGTYATDFLRELIDEAQMTLVLIGDQGLDRLAEVDAHLAARTPIRIALQNFGNKGNDWFGVIRTLLNSVEQVNASSLLGGLQMQRLHTATGGNMRQLKWLICEAVMVAVDAKSEAIRDKDMALAFERLNGAACERSNPWKS